MLGLQAYPSCLQPLVQHVLLSMLGDLEAVWGNAELQEVLLGLPLPHMELLLSRDELQVSLVAALAILDMPATFTPSTVGGA